GHAPFKRKLLGFIHDTHAPAADLAQEAVIAQPGARLQVPGRQGAGSGGFGLPGFGRVHGGPPIAVRSWARARAHSFFTLSRVRSMRPATSGKLRPSRWRRMMPSR